MAEAPVWPAIASATFGLSELAALLRSDHPSGMQVSLDLTGFGGQMDLAFTGLLHTVRTGRPAWEAVFGAPCSDMSSASFSLESGAAILRRHFESVTVNATSDILNVTDARDIVNYLTSFPPGAGADAAILEILERELASRMADGVFPITRIAGYLVATGHKA